MSKYRFLLILFMLVLWVSACGAKTTPSPTPAPTATPTATSAPTFTPTPTSTSTPAPSPTPTPEPKPTAPLTTDASQQTFGVKLEHGEDGIVFYDYENGYHFMLPGEHWIPFLPSEDDMNMFIDAAQASVPNVDVGVIKQMMERIGAQFRLYAFYTGQDGRSEDFASNINVITTPLETGYDMTVVAKINKEQLLQTFSGSEVISESQITNSNGVRVGLVTIKNPIVAADGGTMPLAQTFIFSQTPDNVLISMTFSTPIEDMDAMKPLIEQMADSIAFINPQ